MRKIDLLDYGNKLDVELTLELIKEFCKIIKVETNINVPFSEDLNKNFIYEFKDALKEVDKKLLGKNRYIYFQKEVEWNIIDFTTDYIYNETNEILTLNQKLAICEIIIKSVIVAIEIKGELEEEKE